MTEERLAFIEQYDKELRPFKHKTFTEQMITELLDELRRLRKESEENQIEIETLTDTIGKMVDTK